ncbi:hypothetical protein QBC44DRAFT_322098 [Cladorrhinum sp. PSN332]|nr:hypothetical protein QBC44DRAFT_322098 [Cladorrhinum sp. PSN332]
MLEDELSDFDRQWTKHLKNPPGHCPEYEALLRRMDEEHKKYADLIARMQQLRQGGEVSLEVPMDLLRDMYEEEDLEKGIACGMKALEEFRSFEPAESTWIVWLVRTPFGRWLTRQRSGDPDPRGYPAQDLARLLHFIHVAVAMPLLLVPFAILFLDDLPKDEAFGVIVCSMVVACGILSAISRAKNRLMNIFVVGCAYMAFLAAFAAARYFGVGCDLRGV